METKKTKLTISGKPKKNFYDNQGLTNNKKNKSLLLRKNSLNHLTKVVLDLQNFQEKLFLANHLFNLKQGNRFSLQKLVIMKEENLLSKEQLKKSKAMLKIKIVKTNFQLKKGN